MSSIYDFQKKATEKKLSLCTCYDAWSAKIIAESAIDAILIGDSVSMIQYGYEDTTHATLEMIELSTRAVASSCSKGKLIIADMPIASYRVGKAQSLLNALKLIRAGAGAVKLEGLHGHEDEIEHLIGSGIPVMGHLGLTPQSVHQLGGFKVQGKKKKDADQLLEDALRLEALGCFSLVLECIPSEIAKLISEKLSIPTIGIGAGADCTGQILVLHDLLGLSGDFQPKFLKKFAQLNTDILSALNQYVSEVENTTYPEAKHSY